MNYTIYNSSLDFKSLDIIVTNYSGYRSIILKQTINAARRKIEYDRIATSSITMEEVLELKQAFVKNLSANALVLGSTHSESFPDAVVMRARTGRFDLKNYYGNDSFGNIDSYENFVLQKLETKPSSIMCFESAHFAGSAAIAVANLAKGGIAVLAYSLIDTMTVDIITYLATLFSQTIINSKCIIFIDYKPLKKFYSFHNVIRYYLDCDKTVSLFRENSEETHILELLNSL